VGYTSPTLGGFYYAVFTASSTITSVDLNLQDLLTSNWTFTGIYATNTFLPGRLSGGAVVPTLQGWAPGLTNAYALVGWSSSVAGRDWNTVAARLAGASLRNGVWTGPNWNNRSSGGFIGVTEVGYGEAGGSVGSGLLPPLVLFGAAGTPQGQPIGSPFDMFVVGGNTASAAPEPKACPLFLTGTLFCIAYRRLRAQPQK
jgi:hypothetical protein